MPKPYTLRAPLSMAALMTALTTFAGSALAESYATFQIPGATDIAPVKINGSGTITGTYVASGMTRGFVRSSLGDIATFDVGGAETMPVSINDDGTVVGLYFSGTVVHGFSRDPAGNVTELTVPGADFVAPYANNNVGTVAGIYRLAGQFQNLGYVANPDGSMATVTPPDTADGSVAVTVNNLGASAGFFEYGIHYVGFVRATDGTVSTFEAVGSSGSRIVRQTTPVAINDAGTVAGTYSGLSCPWNCNTVVAKGFLRSQDGSISLFTVGGSRSKTWVSALNNLGQAAGYYHVSGQNQQGYIRDQDGTVVSFAVPNMTLTAPTAINDHSVVVGKALDAKSNVFAFIRQP